MADRTYVSRKSKITEPNTQSPTIRPKKPKIPTCRLKSCKVTKNLDSSGYCRSHVRKNLNVADLYSECKQCGDEVKNEEAAVACDKCAVFYHIECIGMNVQKYKVLMDDAKLDEPMLHWYCTFCRLRCIEAISKIDLLEGQTRNLASNMAKLNERVECLESKMTKTVTQNIRSELDERSDIDRRKNNVIVFNLPEADSPTAKSSVWYTEDSKECDRNAFIEISNESLGVDLNNPHKIKEVLRLGPKRVTERPRPLKVTFSDIVTKREVLQNSKFLKDGKYKSIFINPDLTPQQRKKDYDLRQELKNRKSEGQKGIYIKKGRIVEDTGIPNHTQKRNAKIATTDVDDIPDLDDRVDTSSSESEQGDYSVSSISDNPIDIDEDTITTRNDQLLVINQPRDEIEENEVAAIPSGNQNENKNSHKVLIEDITIVENSVDENVINESANDDDNEERDIGLIPDPIPLPVTTDAVVPSKTAKKTKGSKVINTPVLTRSSVKESQAKTKPVDA